MQLFYYYYLFIILFLQSCKNRTEFLPTGSKITLLSCDECYSDRTNNIIYCFAVSAATLSNSDKNCFICSEPIIVKRWFLKTTENVLVIYVPKNLRILNLLGKRSDDSLIQD